MNERNRHGVPTYKPSPAPKCVMPKCRDKPHTWPDLHLCDIHVRAVWQTADHILGFANRHQWQPTPAPEPVEKPKRTAPTDGVVYYVKVGGTHIKIGWASDLTKRMRQYPPNTELLAAHPGTRADEQRLHKRFAVHRSHGREWYPLVPVVLDHVQRMVQQHGKPDDVQFGAKPTTVPQPRPKHFVGTRGRGKSTWAPSA